MQEIRNGSPVLAGLNVVDIEIFRPDPCHLSARVVTIPTKRSIGVGLSLSRSMIHQELSSSTAFNTRLEYATDGPPPIRIATEHASAISSRVAPASRHRLAW